MDAVTIICLVGAFVVGAIIAWFVKGKGSSDKELETAKLDRKSLEAQHDKLSEKLEEAMRENESLERQKDALSTNLDYMMKDRDRALAENKELAAKVRVSSGADLKEKYEKLLKEANDQCEKLDKELKNALNGKIDDAIKQKLADAETLKKKNQDLKDQLEESQDDVSDLKKKIKGKDTEISDLQDSLTKEQKVSKQLHTDLDEKKQELEKQKRELELKKGSLEFVQEILSAPEVSRSDITKLYENIANMKTFATEQLLDCYATFRKKYVDFGGGGFDAYREYWKTRFQEWASVTAKSWINGKTAIAFVGEFSAGKTSIVNRILSQDDENVPKLPVSTKATTAIATYIAGGPVTSYQFVTPDDKIKTISQKTFTEKVSKEVLDQVNGISELIQYFVMTYKNPALNGLSILDTPGFNSTDSRDASRTLEVINECDALFWVFDVNTGEVDRSAIKLIKENLKKPLYVVINKVDTMSPIGVQRVETKIRQTLASEGVAVESFIRFSSKSALSDIMTPIKNVRRVKENERYLHDLGDSIDNIINILQSQEKDAKSEFDQAVAYSVDVDNKFVESMRILYGNCSTAAGVPHYEEHVFRKDNYEMSQQEYSYLCNLLEQSVTNVELMGKIYDERTESAQNVQNKWEIYWNAKEARERVQHIKQQFAKFKKPFV